MDIAIINGVTIQSRLSEGHDYQTGSKKKVDPIELYGKLSGSVCYGVPAELHQTTWCSEMAIEFIKKIGMHPGCFL